MARVLTNETFNSEVLISKKPCLIDFYADWCGPCRVMAPVIEELAQKYENRFDVYKLDVDKAGEVAAKYGIASIPTLMFFKDGVMAENIVGIASKDILEKKIQYYLN